MTETFIIYFLVSVLASTVFYIIGGIILNILKVKLDNSYLKVFANLLCGIIASVFIYSIIITPFNAIMIGLLIPFTFILSSFIKQNKVRERLLKTLALNTKTIFLCVIVLLAICGYHVFFLWDIDNRLLIPPLDDHVFYARVSDYMNNKGVESSYLDYFNSNNPAPYHYFELWVTSLIIRIPGLNTILVQEISLNGIFFLLLYFGGLAIVNSVKKVTVIDIIICLFIAFFEGIKLPLFPNVLYHQKDFFFFDNPMIRQKLYMVSILFIASVLLLLRQRKDIALLILLIGCFLNISLVTTVPFIVIVLSIILRTENKIKIITASFLTIAFCYLFYSLNNTSAFWKDNPSLLVMVKDTFSSFTNIKIAFDNTAKSLIEILLIFFPFLFVFYFLKKRDNSVGNILISTTLLIITVVLISAIVWSVFTLKSDSLQLFDNIAIPAVNIYFFTLVLLLLSQLNSVKLYLLYSVFGIWCVFCFINTNQNLLIDKNGNINNYSPEYLHSVKEKLLTMNDNGGRLVKFEGTYNNFKIHFHVYAYKPYLAMIKNNINITMLQSTDNITDWDESQYRSQEKIIEDMQFFNRYINKQKSLNKFVSEEQSRINYIKENNLQFIIADKGVEIDSLLQSITDTIIIDKKSGERFMVIKR